VSVAVSAPRSSRAQAVLVAVAFLFIVLGLFADSLRIGGAVALLLLGIAAVMSKPVLEWRGLAVGLLVIVLYIPMRRYVLPGGMPFQLEPYRLYVSLLVAGWFLSLLADRRVRIVHTGFEAPLLLLVSVTLASELANPARVDSLASPVLKSLTFFVSFILVVYVLVSVIRTFAWLESLVRTLVFGGALISVSAVVESRTGFNVFDHLGQVFPFLKTASVTELGRAGHARAFGPAQHPIALGAALTMLVPLAVYVAMTSRSRAWAAAAVVLVLGAFATVSRTSIVMLVVVLLCFLWLHPRATRRLWPLALPLIVAIHFFLPGTLGTFQSYLAPSAVAKEQTQVGSTLHFDKSNPTWCNLAPRLARVGPMLDLAQQKPIVGWGYGTRITSDTNTEGGPAPNACVLDDQWLGTLLESGGAGLLAWWWLIFSFVGRAMRVAREEDSSRGLLLGALGTSVVSLAIGMFFFDTFSFIQVTFLFFIFIAFGAIALRMSDDPLAVRPWRSADLPVTEVGH
jgi:polysaccharide biosynthesis protein PslJ